MAKDRLTIASSGNISARAGRGMYIKASGVGFENAKASDFVYLNIKNPAPKDKTKRPSCEYRMHIACYKARPDIKAIFHTHPLFSTALYTDSTTDKALTLEYALYLKRAPVMVDFISPGSKKLALAVAGLASEHDIIMVKQHGLVTLGRTMQEAYLKAFILEREAKTRLIYRIMRKKPRYITQQQIHAMITA